MKNRSTRTRLIRILGAGLCLYALLAVVPTQAQEQEQAQGKTAAVAGGIDVKAFGAVGDGKADDTDAIQRAMLAAEAKAQVRRLHFSKGWYGGRNEGAFPEVVFPDGTYRITRALVATKFTAWRGLGKATLRQDDPAANILYQDRAYRCHIENMAFEGGRMQVQFGVANTDASRVTLVGCRFSGSSDAAVHCYSFRDPNEEPKLRPAYQQNAIGKLTVNTSAYPYDVELVDGLPHLKPNDITTFVDYYNSTIVIIRDCDFVRAARALDISTDGLIVENCRIEADPGSEGSVIIARKKAEFSKIAAIAPATDKKQYWFESTASTLCIRDSSFLSAKGMCLVKQQAAMEHPYELQKVKVTHQGISVTVENCKLNAGGNPDGCIVRTEMPINIASIINNVDVSGLPVLALAWDNAPTTLDDFKDIRLQLYKNEKVELKQEFHFCLEPNGKNIEPGLEGVLTDFFRPAVPDAMRKAVTLDRIDVDTDELLARFPVVLDAMSFGVTGDGQTDDTAAVQAALDAAAKTGNARVVFPGGQMRITSTVRIPPSVAMVSAGLGMFVGDNQDVDMFVAEKPTALVFKALAIVNAKTGLRITPGDAPAQVAVEGGLFYDCAEWTLACQTPAGVTNKLGFLIRENIVYGRITSDAYYADLPSNWQCMDLFLHEQAVIENHGQMFVRSMLGVPISLKGNPIFKRHPKPQPETEHPWEYGDNQRWFDNYGRLHTQDLRYGGEGFGFSGVYNFSENATIFIEGAFAKFMNVYCNKCQVYFVKPARACVVFNLRGLALSKILLPVPGMEKEKQLLWKAAEGVSVPPESLFVSAVMPVLP